MKFSLFYTNNDDLPLCLNKIPDIVAKDLKIV